MILCWGNHRQPLLMRATQSYCPEEIHRNGKRLMDRGIKLFLCVEGRFVQVHTLEELALASRIVSVYHAQIGGGPRTLDQYMDSVENTMDSVWAELGDDCEDGPKEPKPAPKEPPPAT